MKVAILGGGIAGLGFALGLHERGIDCEVYESVPEVKEMRAGASAGGQYSSMPRKSSLWSERASPSFGCKSAKVITSNPSMAGGGAASSASAAGPRLCTITRVAPMRRNSANLTRMAVRGCTGTETAPRRANARIMARWPGCCPNDKPTTSPG